MRLKETDVLIIGGGPAGATAAIYTARAGYKTTIIYKDLGALEKAECVENFYGFSKISGKSLIERGLKQARLSGAKTIRGEVVGIRRADDESASSGNIIVETATGMFEGKAVLLATGASRAAPNIQGLAELEGRGVSYCAICDGFFYRGENDAVLGNGAYALHEVLDLLPLAASVTVITNGEEPTVTFPKAVSIRMEKIVKIISGENPASPLIMQGVTLNPKTSISVFKGVVFESEETTEEALPLSGLFIAEGAAGTTELARKIGAVLTNGSIKINDEFQTSVQGLWAAGDNTGGLKQIAKASHEGAEAGLSIVKFLRENF
jgi:thioredoxin reductase (NADPH)